MGIDMNTTPPIVLAALAILCLALAVFALAVVIFRSAMRQYHQNIEIMASQAVNPCHHRAAEGVPCARPAGHSGPHLVRFSDVIRAGYHPAPF